MRWCGLILVALGGWQLALAQDPPSLGLHARYVGGTGLQANASGVVTQWWEHAGGGRHLDRRGGSPRSLAVTANGTNREVLRLGGAAWLWATSGAFGALTNDRTVVVRGRLPAAGEGFLFDGSTSAGMTRGRVRQGSWEMGYQPSPIANATNADVPTVAASTGVWQTHEFSFDHQGATLVMEHVVDGASAATVTQAVAGPLAGFIVGANVQQQFPCAVDVAEILVYSQRLDTVERAALQAYLTNTWGQIVVAPMTVQTAFCSQVATTIPPFGVHGLLRLDVTAGSGDPARRLTNVVCQLAATTGVTTLQLFATGDGRFPLSTPVGPEVPAAAGAVNVPADVTLAAGASTFWIGLGVSGAVRPGDTYDGALAAVQFDDGSSVASSPGDPPGQLTVGAGIAHTVLRRRGDDGVSSYRIPGLAVSRAGTLLAVFDIRYASSADLPADIDVGLMRSTDLGRTWQPMQVVMDFDASLPGSSGNGVGDPSILVDRETGRIWVAGLWSFGANGYVGSGAGLSTNDTGQYVLSYSDDDGVTWSPPTNITAQAKTNVNWGVCFQGPGAGLQLRDGTLVFPSQYAEPGGANPRVFMVYSTNHGAVWQAGPPVNPSVPPHLNENQMAELNDGGILASCRVPTGGGGKRAWSTYRYTNDLAAGGWSPVVFTNRDPVCQASLCRHTSTRDGHAFDRLLFANPDGTSRTNMTVRLSEDEGVTWPVARIVEPRPSGYSCLAVLPDGTVGLLYECGLASSIETLAFARFNLEWLLGDADSDGDGVPDHYEARTGLATNVPDADADLDGDGVTNRDEYRAGTRADQSNSALRVSATSASDLTWSSVPWRRYTVQQATDLVAAAWTDWPGCVGLLATTALMRCAWPPADGGFVRARMEEP